MIQTLRLRPARVLIASLLVGAAFSSRVQSQGSVQLQARDSLCLSAIRSMLQADATPTNPCFSLATRLTGEMVGQRFNSAPVAPNPLLAVSGRDIQSRAGGNAGELGIGSTTAVAGIQPIALGGISLSALGTEGGASSLLAISLNPLGLTTSSQDSAAISRTRLFDATLYVPAEPGDSAASSSPKYWGVRLRINTAARGATSKLTEAGREYAKVVGNRAASVESLTEFLRKAPRLADCAAEVRSGSVATPAGRDACGGPLPGAGAEVDERQFLRRVSEIRDQVDSKYFGADIRYEQGDPSLGAAESLSGTFINAALAGGIRLPAALRNESRLELRGRLGVQYLSVDSGSVVSELTTGYATDAAIALQLTYPQAFRPLVAQLGLDMRSSGGLDQALSDALERGGTSLALSIDFPLGESNGVSISYLKPFRSKLSPRLTVSYNAQLLMSNALGAARP